MKRKKQRKNKISDEVLDGLVRNIVYFLASGYCKRCKRHVSTAYLEAAHLYRRHRKTVRWDLRNVHGLCLDCHQLVDNDAIEMASFMYDILSKDDINDLQRLANMTLKEYPIDRAELKAELKEKIGKL